MVSIANLIFDNLISNLHILPTIHPLPRGTSEYWWNICFYRSKKLTHTVNPLYFVLFRYTQFGNLYILYKIYTKIPYSKTTCRLLQIINLLCKRLNQIWEDLYYVKMNQHDKIYFLLNTTINSNRIPIRYGDKVHCWDTIWSHEAHRSVNEQSFMSNWKNINKSISAHATVDQSRPIIWIQYMSPVVPIPMLYITTLT